MRTERMRSVDGPMSGSVLLEPKSPFGHRGESKFRQAVAFVGISGT
jgi:hypothetical protein